DEVFFYDEIDGVKWRAYKTGDMGYLLDGNIYYCGRKDFQIKLPMTYNELNSPMASSAFDFLSDIKSLCEGKVSDTKVDVDAKSMT
ncbi:hypothetical protein ACTPEF_24865, partial [Clostridioides difficile]